MWSVADVICRWVGTKLTWVGWTPSGYPTGKSQASYSVDGGPATAFDILGLPDRSPALYNQHLFETPNLNPGEHTLTVTHGGPSAPLTIDHLLIANGDILLPGGGTTGDETQDESSAASGTAVPSDNKKPAPVGAIAGGAAGGAAFLIILVLFIILFLKRKKRKQRLDRVDVLKGGVHFPAPIAQVTPFMYATQAERPPGALNLMAPSQEHLTQASQMPAGWGVPAGGYQPVHGGQSSYPRDRKVRPLPVPGSPGTPAQNIAMQQLSGSPRGPLSDTSSSSGVIPGGRAGSVSNHSGSAHSKSASGPLERQQVLLHHQDSGIRLPHSDQGAPPALPPDIIDVPPLYTPS